MGRKFITRRPAGAMKFGRCLRWAALRSRVASGNALVPSADGASLFFLKSDSRGDFPNE